MGKINKYDRRNQFTQVGNEALRDKKISWGARGLLGYLLSLPPDWDLIMSNVCKMSDNDGKDSTNSKLKELLDFRYVVRFPCNEGQPRMYDYFVDHFPIPSSFVPGGVVIEPKKEVVVEEEVNVDVNQKIRDEIERQLLKMESLSKIMEYLGGEIGVEEGIRAFSQYWVDNENERTIVTMPERTSKSALNRDYKFSNSYKGVISSFKKWAEISKEKPERVLTSSHEHWDDEIAEVWTYMENLWWKRGFVLTEKRKKKIEVDSWMLQKMKQKWFTKIQFMQFVWGIRNLRKPTQENMADYIGEEHLVRDVIAEVLVERERRMKNK